jgi:hypothetical protein
MSMSSPKMKRGDVLRTPPQHRIVALFLGAARAVAAAASPARAEIDARIDAETISHEIHGHGFGLFVKVFVDDELKSVCVENAVGVARLIQSHCQRRSASPALVQKDTDGGNLLVFEIFCNLMMGCRGDLYHVVPPRIGLRMAGVGAMIEDK